MWLLRLFTGRIDKICYTPSHFFQNTIEGLKWMLFGEHEAGASISLFLKLGSFLHIAAMHHTAIRRLRLIGTAEGTSMLVLLFVAMPLKYFAGMPLAVKYVGWLHGLLFILFMLAALDAYNRYNWPFKRLVHAFIAAFLPFGTFVFDKWLKQQEKVVQ